MYKSEGKAMHDISPQQVQMTCDVNFFQKSGKASHSFLYEAGV